MQLELFHTFNVGPSVKFPMRAFLSVQPETSGLIGVLREFDPQRGDLRTDLRLLRFTPQGAFVSDEFLCEGEDPRLFCWKGGFYVISMVWRSADTTPFLIDLQAGTLRPLAPAGLTFRGKNWVPVPAGEQLFVIRSIDPLVIIEVTGDACKVVVGDPTTTHIGEFRGGGAARFVNGRIEGFGHRTVHSDLHQPFHYSIDPATWKVHIKPAPLVGVNGVGIVDPTSEFGEYVAVCGTPGRWTYVQEVLHGLAKIVEAPAAEASPATT